MSNEFNYEFNYILFCFLAIPFSLSYSMFMDRKEEDSVSPPRSSHSYFINHSFELSQVSIHKVSTRNIRMNKTELESQYIVRAGNGHEAERKISDTIEHEIECPRCYNIMTLCSDFDSLYYLCEECDFSLYTLK